MIARFSILALLCGTPLVAEGLEPATFADLGYVLDGFQNSVTKTGQTEDSEHFEVKLRGSARIRVSFEFSAEVTTLFDHPHPYGTKVRDGVEVFFLTDAVGQALCAQSQEATRVECIVLTESFFALMFDRESDLEEFPYIHFVSDDAEFDALTTVVSSLRRAPQRTEIRK